MRTLASFSGTKEKITQAKEKGQISRCSRREGRISKYVSITTCSAGGKGEKDFVGLASVRRAQRRKFPLSKAILAKKDGEAEKRENIDTKAGKLDADQGGLGTVGDNFR